MGLGGLLEFLFGYFADLGADRPGMAERVDDLAIAVSPELIGEWHGDGTARRNSLVEDRVGFLDMKVENDGRAAEGLRC